MTRATATRISTKIVAGIQNSRLAANKSLSSTLACQNVYPPESTIRSYLTTTLHSSRFPALFQNNNDLPSPSIDRTVRGMAIKKKRKSARVKPEREDLPLMNEDLIKQMMANSNVSSPSDIRLRLVIEKDAASPTTSEETTLASAIQTSLDLGLDLVEIDLDNPKLPVVRALDYEAKVYRLNKDKAKKKTKDLGVKEFRFQARTADHDFQRKINDLIEALEKGHNCKVQARCPPRVVLTTNPEGAVEVIQRVIEEVGSQGEATKPPEFNPEKTQATVLLVPSKKK